MKYNDKLLFSSHLKWAWKASVGFKDIILNKKLNV